MKKEIGRFYCESGKLIAIDPTYSIDEAQYYGTVEKAVRGEWIATITVSDNEPRTVRCLTAEPVNAGDYEIASRDRDTIEVGVGSGFAGVFDADHYQEGDRAQWITNCINAIQRFPNPAWTIPFGMVSTTTVRGHACEVGFTGEGQVVRVEIIFNEDED